MAPQGTDLGRGILAVFMAVLIEVMRYIIHPGNYVGYWWVLVTASLGLNIAYHVWSLPATYAKVTVSALYKQTTLPYAVSYMWIFLQQLIRPLP